MDCVHLIMIHIQNTNLEAIPSNLDSLSANTRVYVERSPEQHVHDPFDPQVEQKVPKGSLVGFPSVPGPSVLAPVHFHPLTLQEVLSPLHFEWEPGSLYQAR